MLLALKNEQQSQIVNSEVRVLCANDCFCACLSYFLALCVCVCVCVRGLLCFHIIFVGLCVCFCMLTDLVKHGVLSLVDEIPHFRNYRY